jgi:AAA+ ATPase superfamily predicted ATPase
MKNPFIVSGYAGPEFFCDREIETAKVIEAAQNKRHLTILSIRRMGKTGLIDHVFSILTKQNLFSCFYVDLFPTTSIQELAQQFGKAVFSQFTKNESLLKKLSQQLYKIRPSVSYDPITGIPDLSLKIDNDSDAIYTLDSTFQFLEQLEKPAIVAFDEFQQISEYPEKNTEALLRSFIQKMTNSTFIFSGSAKTVLTEIFSNPKRPFFSSTQLLELTEINHNTYHRFIKSHFQQNGLSISDEAIQFILEKTHSHTFFVQQWCNRLFAKANDVDSISAEKNLREIISENEPIYANYQKLLTHFQFRLLRAIAKEKGIKNLFSKEFISNYKLGTPSSVQTALKSLENKDFIHEKDGYYYVTDRFFSIWLANGF